MDDMKDSKTHIHSPDSGLTMCGRFGVEPYRDIKYEPRMVLDYINNPTMTYIEWEDHVCKSCIKSFEASL
jgi:hypothetical protein